MRSAEVYAAVNVQHQCATDSLTQETNSVDLLPFSGALCCWAVKQAGPGFYSFPCPHSPVWIQNTDLLVTLRRLHRRCPSKEHFISTSTRHETLRLRQSTHLPKESSDLSATELALDKFCLTAFLLLMHCFQHFNSPSVVNLI